MKVLVAMSGGVDSSVAAAVLRDQGHDVTGVTLKLWGGASDSGCCSVSDVEDARRVAAQLDVPHYVFNFAEEFDARVVEHYVESYASGRTPNPCIECNRSIKWGRLYERAAQPDRAREAFDRASASADRYVRAQAFSRLGVMHRRDGRHDDAAKAWKGVLEAASGRRSLFPLERAATEALAIHHEHRAQDFDEAKRYAESMKAQSSGRAASCTPPGRRARR